ncbi:MAG: hypothetical protein ACI305_05345 [Lepagella sp.]
MDHRGITVPLLLCALLLCACSRKVYVPVQNDARHTDTVKHYINNTDSVTVIERIYEADTRYDSIAPILDSLNRVIGWDRYHFRESTKKDSREIQRMQSLVDSLKSARVDSVERQVPYPVERSLTKWEQTKMDFGGVALGGVVIAVCIAVVWLIRKFRK